MRTSPGRLVAIGEVYPDLEHQDSARALKEPRVSCARSEVSIGPSVNYSKGVDEVDGECVVNRGRDDRLLPRHDGRVKVLFS
jgi:hypothetical protein